MQRTCILAPDINKCPHYKADTGSCVTNNNVCGFFMVLERKEKKAEYKREPRWYEQYYNR